MKRIFLPIYIGLPITHEWRFEQLLVRYSDISAKGPVTLIVKILDS